VKGPDLEGRRILVTGGGSGIGAAISVRLGACGAAVAVNDAVAERASEVAQAVAATGARSVAVSGDVATASGAAEVVSSAVDALGGLDGLANNAGILRGGPLATLDEESWRQVIDVNLTAAFLVSQRALPALSDGGGAIVNTSSLVALAPPPGAGAYNASKAGLLSLTQHMAVEWGPLGIRANAVLPGLIPGTRLTPTGGGPAELHARRGAVLPLRRVGAPEDVADVVAFFMSDLARYVTGQWLCVDGGMGLALQTLLPS
jgi:NAD(P)-dependent dehydrogenase (short-subunit alcohol dehydrogenase family)